MNVETSGQEKMASTDHKAKLSKEQMELILAVETGTIEQVQDLAEKSEILNRDEPFDYLLLISALKRGHNSISKFLLQRVCVVKAPVEIESYHTPLYYAIEMNDQDIFEELLKRGASIYDEGANKMSALEFAMLKHSKSSTWIKLILHGIKNWIEPKTLVRDAESDIALFHAACWAGDLEAIQIFKSHNFSLNSRSTFQTKEWKGFTPLHFIIKGRNIADGDIDAVLKYEDIDFYAQDERGRTCLHIAFLKVFAYSSITKILMGQMSRSDGKQLINPIDENGLSHFHIFCSSVGVLGEDALNHVDFIKYFTDIGEDLDAPVSLDAQKFPGFTALHFAARDLSWQTLKLLIKYGADPTKTDKNGSTPLHLLYEHETSKEDHHLEIVKLLLQRGADLFAKDSNDCTPLHIAFRAHNEIPTLNDSEEFFLSKNQESINHTDKYGVSYLHIACTGDYLGVVEALVNNGASVNSCIKTDSPRYASYSPLHFAVESQQVEIVEFLLSRGADVKKSIGKTKTTSLHLACRFNQHSFPNRNRRKKDDLLIDWLPSRTKQFRIIELLLEYGADVNVEDLSGRTALMESFTIPGSVYKELSISVEEILGNSFKELFIRQQKIMDILLHHGANINAQESFAGSILHMLAENLGGYPLSKDLAEIVLNRGANVNAVEKFTGDTPLHVALKVSIRDDLDTSFIDLLLEYGADINAKAKDLNTPLHAALQYLNHDSKFENILIKLLDHPKIDINVSDNCERTPLHIALLSQPNYFATKKLLEAGADINVEDCDGNPPIFYLVKYFEYKFDDADDDDGNDDNDLKVLVTIIVYLKRMMILNLYISEKVENHFNALLQFLSKEYLTVIDTEINKEVEELKSHKVDSYTSVYDILFKDSTAMAKHVVNKEVRSTVLSIHCDQKYPLFGDIIKRHFLEGYDRLKLLEPAKKALSFITSINWTDSCSESILRNLSDDILKDLIQCLPSHETRK